MSSCQHGTSLYGRCIDCGMTWAEQLRQFRVLCMHADSYEPGREPVPAHWLLPGEKCNLAPGT